MTKLKRSGTQRNSLEVSNLLVVTVVEGTVGDAEKSAGLGVVGILAITLEQSEGSHKVPLLQEMVSVWQAELLLLSAHKHRLETAGQTWISFRPRSWLYLSGFKGKRTCFCWILGALALLRLMAETGLAIILNDLNLNYKL